MATIKGSFSGVSQANLYPEIVWTETVNTAANKSTVTATLFFTRLNTAYQSYNASIPVTISINGNSASTTVGFDVRNNNHPQIWSRTVDVPHDANGKKSIHISASGNTGVSLGTFSVSGTATLKAIPRAYSFVISSTSATMGNKYTIKVNDNGSKFTAKARLVFGSATIQFASGGNVPIGGNTDITLDPAILGPAIPNAKSGKGSVTVDTYNGSTKIGSSSQSVTITIPDGLSTPTVNSVTATETNSVVTTAIGATGTSFIQSQSKITFTVDRAAKHGATVANTQVLYENVALPVVDGKAMLDLATKNVDPGEITVTAKAIDSRGFSATKDLKLTVLAYAAPAISSFTAMRNTKTQTTIDVAKTGTVSSIIIGTTEKNTYTATTEYRLINSETWTVAKTESNAFANVEITGTDIKKSYEVRVTLTDKFSSATAVLAVSTARYPLTFYKDEGVGVGKLYEPGHGSLDVADMIWMMGRSLLDTFYPIGTIYQSTNSVDPGTFMGGTWERYAKGQVLIGVDENDTDFATAEKLGGSKDTGKKIYRTGTNYGGINATGKSDPYYARVFVSSADDLNTQAVATAYPISIVQPYTTVYTWKRIA